MESELGEARNVTLGYRLPATSSDSTSLSIKGQIKAAGDKQWSDVALSCADFALPNTRELHCNNGKVISKPVNGTFALLVKNSQDKTQQKLAGQLHLHQLNFNDEAGLHAGEKVTGTIVFDAAKPVKQPSDWQWNTEVDWIGGEVFWQPFYLSSGGHHLKASGKFGEQLFSIDKANLTLKNVGRASFSGLWRGEEKKLEDLAVDASDLDLAALYPLVLKPMLEKTMLNNLEMEGKASLKLAMENGEYRTFELDIDNADIDDKNGRFALYKLSASIPWSYEDARNVRLAYEGGHVLKLPLGKTSLAAEVNRYSVTAPNLKLPILDGALSLSDVSAAWVNKDWHWHLRANIEPITMSEFSGVLGWPRMEGKVSGTIPLVTYTGGKLTTEGAMLFNVFNGSITVTDLAMQDPLGIGPRMTGNLQMRNLDLGDLSRTYSFGAIEGKLDGDVKNLQLVNWKPVNFDADVRSSPGKYPKKISQRAVENISSLGGAGATAAIQRSVLRFFKEFNYEKIGLSCRLRGDICEMGGVESTPQGYVIVKGSGVPSITVLGYNRSVSWGELLERLKRVTAGNAKPIVR